LFTSENRYSIADDEWGHIYAVEALLFHLILSMKVNAAMHVS